MDSVRWGYFPLQMAHNRFWGYLFLELLTVSRRVSFESVERPNALIVVFDWDNQNIHLAQAANCISDVVAIGKETASTSMSSLVGNCGQTPRSNTTTSSNMGSGNAPLMRLDACIAFLAVVALIIAL